MDGLSRDDNIAMQWQSSKLKQGHDNAECVPVTCWTLFYLLFALCTF